MKMKSALILFLLSAIFLIHVTPKVVNGYEPIGKFVKNPWRYVTKFAIAPGKGEFKARFQFGKALQKTNLPNKVNMTLFIFLDEDWDKVKTADTCATKGDLARLTKTVQVSADGRWSPEFSGFLTQSIRTHVWFFVLADCEKNLAPYTQANRIKWQLEVYNSDRSHFSQEENGLIFPLILVMTIIVGFFISNSIKFIKFYRTEESIDYPTLIITVALFFELVSLVCEVGHLWIYSMDGKGSFVLNLANQALSLTSQFLITCLLLLMAYGWSINFFRFNDMKIFLPLGIILGIGHILMIGMAKLGDDEKYTYHDYENWSGNVVVGMRLFLFAFWMFLYRRTRSNAKQSEKIFFNQFGLLSAVYFTAVPVVVFLANTVIAPYYRHKVVTIGTLMLQIVTLVIFTVLFTTKSNKYYQISMKGKTLLPSNKLL